MPTLPASTQARTSLDAVLDSHRDRKHGASFNRLYNGVLLMYYAQGKEVLCNAMHVCDCVDENTAKLVASALNFYAGMHNA